MQFKTHDFVSNMKDIAPHENCPDASDAETSATLDESVWCGAHGVRYTDDFRSVVYKINPTHLSCVYKKMFEASATNSLLGIDTDDLDDGDKKSDFTKKMKDENNTWATLIRPQVPGSCVSLHSAQSKYKFDIPPPHRGQSQIIRSVSSAYTCTSASDKAITKKEFRGWDICARPHSAESSGYLKFTSAETRDMMRNRSQSACVKMCVKREKVSMSKVQISGPPRAQSTAIRTSRDGADNRDAGQGRSNNDNLSSAQSTIGRRISHYEVADESPSHTSSTGSSNHSIPVPCPYVSSPNPLQVDAISYDFEHFVEPKDHTKKYREDYTYRKLEMIRNPQPGSSVLRLNVPSSCIPITVPVFMSTNNVNEGNANICKGLVDTTPTPTRSPSPGRPLSSEASSEDIRIAIHCRKAVIKKRLSKPPLTEAGQKVPHYLLAQNGTLKMEFYNNPMTFDVPSSGAGGLVSMPSPIVCRSRPTIPSNAHGNIYPSSTDTHSYVIKRRNGIQ